MTGRWEVIVGDSLDVMREIEGGGHRRDRHIPAVR
jgi:hypothetical protein